LRVKLPAHTAPPGASSRDRSGLPEGFNPAVTPAARKPLGAVMPPAMGCQPSPPGPGLLAGGPTSGGEAEGGKSVTVGTGQHCHPYSRPDGTLGTDPDRHDEHFECLRFWPSDCAPVASKPGRALDQAALGQTIGIGADKRHWGGSSSLIRQAALAGPIGEFTTVEPESSSKSERSLPGTGPAHEHDPAY
jgi:hypothetical protein